MLTMIGDAYNIPPRIYYLFLLIFIAMNSVVIIEMMLNRYYG